MEVKVAYTRLRWKAEAETNAKFAEVFHFHSRCFHFNCI